MAKWIKTNFPGVRYRQHDTRKHGAKWDQYFTIRYKHSGKDKEEGLGWASEGWTATKAYDRLKELKENRKTGEGPQTLAQKRELLDRQEEAIETEKKRQDKESITFANYFINTYLPDTIHKKSNQVEKFIYDKWIDPVIGKLKINDITEFHLKKIQKRMQDGEKAVRTIHYAFAIVSQAWNRARKDKIVQRDCPTRDVDLPRIDNQKKRYLRKEEAESLLAYLKSKSQQLYELAYLSLYTGARFSELAWLTWRRINLDDGSIIFRNTKSGKDPTVFMTDGVKQLFGNMNPGSPDNLIFTDKQGKRLLSVSNTFDRAIAEMGLNAGVIDPRDKITFHSLRHTHASWLVDSGTNLYVVKEILGHADFKMTQRYSHVAADSIRQAMVGLEKHVSRMQNQSEADQQQTNDKVISFSR